MIEVKVKIDADEEVNQYSVRLVTDGTPMTYEGAYKITRDLYERFKAAKEAYQAVEVELGVEVHLQDQERNKQRSLELAPKGYRWPSL